MDIEVKDGKFLTTDGTEGVTIVTNTLSHKVTKSGQDAEGLERWSFTTIEEVNQNKITIINAYRLCKMTKNKEITNFWHSNGTYLKNKDDNPKIFAKQWSKT